MTSLRTGHIATWLAIGAASAMGLAGVGVWQIAPCTFEGHAEAEYTGEIDVPYTEFRTMMVRNNATESIVEHGGMKVVSEEVLEMDIDMSRDSRPLINALLRRSKSCVTATKRLTVAVNNAEIRADNLVLLQDAEITPEKLDVESMSENPAGDLRHYRTTLHAEPHGQATLVRVTVDLQLCKEVSKLFHHEAQQRLEDAARDTVSQQYEALVSFAHQNSKAL